MIRRLRGLLGMSLKAVEMTGMDNGHPAIQEWGSATRTISRVLYVQGSTLKYSPTERYIGEVGALSTSVCAPRALEIVAKWIPLQWNPPCGCNTGAACSGVENRNSRTVQPLTIAPTKGIPTEYQAM
ncbi:hypothetical protein V491_07332 [Pseudogymnoascus sp. VKM F-3775]|nr:hypothetical protein V491_07332 [Pseudogymnoascus sp. VKM F-3775]